MTKLAALVDDTKYWIENKTYNMDEIAIRFHHRLVSIHAFSNGNGRHARLMTDILLEINGEEKFSWGMNTSDIQRKPKPIAVPHSYVQIPGKWVQKNFCSTRLSN